MDSFRVILLAYPQNPVGSIFLSTFLDCRIPVKGIIIEKKNYRMNLNRFQKKVKKDGFKAALHRIFQIFLLKMTNKNITSLAKKNGIIIYTVDKFNDRTTADLLASLNADVLAICSAPILEEYIFNKARHGCLNAHPGWLPKYRGLGANAYAIQNGDPPGITIHFIDAGIDTGRIILREEIQIGRNDTVSKINDRAMKRGAQLMADVIQKIRRDELMVSAISEPSGNLYKAMQYNKVKELNRKLNGMKGGLFPTRINSLFKRLSTDFAKTH